MKSLRLSTFDAFKTKHEIIAKSVLFIKTTPNVLLESNINLIGNVFDFVECFAGLFQLFVHRQQVADTSVLPLVLSYEKNYVFDLHSPGSSDLAGFVGDFCDELDDKVLEKILK